MQPFVVKEKCNGCGICIEFCPADAIIKKDSKAFITIECVECGACAQECPKDAILLEEEDEVFV